MSRRKKRGRRRGPVPNAPPSPTLPRPGYREYLERCESSGKDPVDFVPYLERARRWRTEYGPARDRGDVELMRELEDLLCV